MRTVATEADRDERSVVQGVKDDLTKSPDDPSQWAAG
jgi:hypothetical protein